MCTNIPQQQTTKSRCECFLTNLSYGRESLLLLSCNFRLRESGKRYFLSAHQAPLQTGVLTVPNPHKRTFRRGISLACCTSKCSSLTCCLTSGGTGLQQAMMPWGSLRKTKEKRNKRTKLNQKQGMVFKLSNEFHSLGQLLRYLDHHMCW